MTKRRNVSGGKGSSRKLKVKKETIRDLDAKRPSRDVKGGWIPSPISAACNTAKCPSQGCATLMCGVLIG